MDKAAQYLTLADVRHVLHISDSTARRLIREGQLTAYRFGGQLRFAPDDVKAFIEASRVPVAG